jgi:hypothetical protein
MPPTTPVGLMVATDTGAILHVPPLAVLLSVIVLPTHNGAFPTIGAGTAVTVTIVVTDPQPKA